MWKSLKSMEKCRKVWKNGKLEKIGKLKMSGYFQRSFFIGPIGNLEKKWKIGEKNWKIEKVWLLLKKFLYWTNWKSGARIYNLQFTVYSLQFTIYNLQFTTMYQNLQFTIYNLPQFTIYFKGSFFIGPIGKVVQESPQFV